MEGPKMQAITVDNSGVTSSSTPKRPRWRISRPSWVPSRPGTPDAPVVIRGDTSTPYQTIMDVLDTVGRVGFSNIGLATKPKK
ncbi:MAG: biopolymer transporter ExbD [Chthoniobacter sp.]